MIQELESLYKDLQHYDPHVRQNAVIELGRFFEDEKSCSTLSEGEKSNILNKILSRLEPSETSIEVKGRTVLILSKIAKFSKEQEIVLIFSKVINFITNEKSEGKDIYITCIKSLLGQVPSSSCYMIGKVIIPVLTKGIMNSENEEIIELCLDAYTDFIKAFNYVLVQENDSIIENKIKLVEQGINHISSTKEILQQNAINFVGNFSLLLSHSQINNTLKYLIESISKTKKIKLLISYFNTLNSMALQSAEKHSKFINNIIELTLQYANKDFVEKDDLDYDEKNQLVESVLNLQETYLNKVGNTLGSYIDKIINNLKILIEYDPNYSYEQNEEEQDDCSEYDNDDYDDYEDIAALEDSSWKVRKASVGALHAIANSGIIIKKENKISIIQELVKCLREHDENTKFDIISCLGSYLSSLYVKNSENSNQDSKNNFKLVRVSSIIEDVMPQIINDLLLTIKNNLKGKNSKLIIKTLELLINLATIAGSDVIGQFDELKPSFDSIVFADSQNSILFFKFLSQLFISNSDESEYEETIEYIMQIITKGLNDKYYQVSNEAALTIYHLLPVISKDMNQYNKYFKEIYDLLYPKLNLHDVESELKCTLIKTFGELIIYSGKAFDTKIIKNIFKSLMDKCQNENLRPLILSVLIKILKNSNELDLTAPLSQYKEFLIDLLSKTLPLNVKILILSFINLIFTKYPQSFKGQESNLINTIKNIKLDETLAPYILDVYISMDQFLNQKDIKDIIDSIYTHIDDITLNDSLTTSILKFLNQSSNKINIQNVKPIFEEIKACSINVTYNKSKFIAMLAGICKEDSNLINFCLSLLSKKDIQTLKNVSKLIGNLCMFSSQSHFDIISKLENLVKKSDEDLKVIIAISIGKIGLSDVNAFINKTIKMIPNKLQMYEVREFLSKISNKKINVNNELYNNLYNWLKDNTSKKDSEFNDMCCQCLGIIVGKNRNLLSEYLQNLNGNNFEVSSYYYGIKFLIKNMQKITPEEMDNILKMLIIGLKSKTLQIKTKAFNSLVEISYKYPESIKKYYDELLPIFDDSHKINEEWIETVDFGGGCKIIKDKGEDIRNAVYTTTKILIENIPTKINVPSTIKMCIDGISDNKSNESDIQGVAFTCLEKLAEVKSSAFIPLIDNLFASIKAISDKIKNIDIKVDFYNKVEKLMNELKKEHDIVDQPCFINMQKEIGKIKN